MYSFIYECKSRDRFLGQTTEDLYLDPVIGVLTLST